MAEITEAQRERARRDLRLKLALEQRLSDRWRRLQRRHARRVVRAIASASVIPDLAALTRDEGAPILRDHYGEVWRRFRGDDYGSRLDPPDRAALDEALSDIFDERAFTQAERIGQTDAAEAAEAFTIGEMERERVARDEGAFLAPVSVAAIVGTALLRKMQARRPGIATLETQAPAELAKSASRRIEAVAQILSDDAAGEIFGISRPIVLARVALGSMTVGGLITAGAALLSDPDPPGPTKSWVTVGDEKVRPHHAEAEGQTVSIDEPFLVMGEQLGYPGDASLGASLENLINCRCSVVYE